MDNNENNLFNNSINDQISNPPKKSKKGLITCITLLILIGIGVGCYFCFNGKDKTKENDVTPAIVKGKYTLTGNGINDFDLYFMQLENNEKNLVYSPLSVKYALEMLSEGAKGETKAQIDSIIGDYIARKYTNSNNMSFANALFIKDTFKDSIKSDYIEKLKTKYNADIITDSFATPDNLNNWVSDKTLNMIDKLFEDVSDKEFILANALAIDMEWINNIQGDNGWSVWFPNEKYSNYIMGLEMTGYESLLFNNKIDSKSVKIASVANKYDIVNTLGEAKIRETVKKAYEEWLKEYPDYPELVMGYDTNGRIIAKDIDEYLDKYIEDIYTIYNKFKTSTDFRFFDNDDVKVFEKDLKTYDGTTLEYIGIMPKKEQLSNYIEKINAKSVNEIINNLKDVELNTFEEGYVTEIKGSIPLFKYDSGLALLEDLQKLNIKDVFDPTKADLSNLTSYEGAYISSASQKATIEFSNEGIKAAAATEIGGSGNADGPEFSYSFEVPVKTIDLTFDKPYLYLIVDKETKEVWFAGTVYEPLTCIEEDNCFTHNNEN